MSSFNHSYFFFCIILSTFLSPRTTALPIKDSPYDKFINFLLKNNCSMPSEVELPFPASSDQANFSYLSNPLKECQTSEAYQENVEAKFLCSEIFDVLQNITCFEYDIPLPKIQSNPLSKNICNDFQAMKEVLPRESDYLSEKLVDGTVCRILCTTEKYELLCKTLLWSHDIQAKIKSALENSALENVDMNKIPTSKMDTQSIKLTLQEKPDVKKEITNIKTENEIEVDNKHTSDKKISQKGSDLNNSELSGGKMLSVADQTIPDRIDSKTNNNQNVIGMRTANTVEVTVTSKNASKADDKKVTNEDLPLVKPDQTKEIDQKQNEVKVDMQPEHKVENDVPDGSHLENEKVENNNIPGNPHSENENVENSSSIPGTSQPSAENGKVENSQIASSSANSLTSEINSVHDNDKGDNILHVKVEDKQKQNNVSSEINKKLNGNSEDSVPKDSEMDNELNNVNFEGQENETKVKTNLKSADDENKKLENPKLTDFEIPIAGSSDTDSKPLEATTLEILPDKDEDAEHQEDRDQEQYNDTENEGDYPKSEYDNSFNPPLKNKEVDAKSSIIEGSNQISSNYDTFISSRNNIGRIPDDIPLISSFPEQEDSHFFFYFLSIVLILMAGYLIFHNKQKIIALIVEGRHERRRRSHGAGYKKLETK